MQLRASEMVQMGIATVPDHLRSVPVTHMVEGES